LGRLERGLQDGKKFAGAIFWAAGPVLRGDPTEVHMLRTAGGSPDKG